jgi:hypothetical protein
MEKITTLVFKFRFTPSTDSEEDFQRFPIFIQLEALTAILVTGHNFRRGRSNEYHER